MQPLSYAVLWSEPENHKLKLMWGCVIINNIETKGLAPAIEAWRGLKKKKRKKKEKKKKKKKKEKKKKKKGKKKKKKGHTPESRLDYFCDRGDLRKIDARNWDGIKGAGGGRDSWCGWHRLVSANKNKAFDKKRPHMPAKGNRRLGL